MVAQDIKRIFKARSLIFQEGQPGDAAYLVRTGSVSIVKKTAQGFVPLATIGKNSLFGEMALIDGGNRMASAVAAEDTICSMISLEALQEKLASVPKSSRDVFEILMKYVRETLPWDQRQKNPELAVPTHMDGRVKLLVPPPHLPTPPEFADPVLQALYKLVMDYVRRRLPPNQAAAS